jgi:ABC-type Fe3+-hydroxamate transport system substrate-binding protein
VIEAFMASFFCPLLSCLLLQMYLNVAAGKPSPIQSHGRIISLVPSQTELLFDLGLDAEVTGITKFCVHPDSWFRSKTRIGGTKKLNIELIRKLRPDLVLANKEENLRHEVDILAEEFPVWVSDIGNLAEALNMIDSVGILTGKEKKAQEISAEIKIKFASLDQTKPTIRSCYLIWKDPWMTVGGDTFISDMMDQAGYSNVFADYMRYPEISIEQIIEKDCDLLMLSSEPFPFKEKHIAELKIKIPATKIILVDGEMFSWYGSRLKKAAGYFEQLRQTIK